MYLLTPLPATPSSQHVESVRLHHRLTPSHIEASLVFLYYTHSFSLPSSSLQLPFLPSLPSYQFSLLNHSSQFSSALSPSVSNHNTITSPIPIPVSLPLYFSTISVNFPLPFSSLTPCPILISLPPHSPTISVKFPFSYSLPNPFHRPPFRTNPYLSPICINYIHQPSASFPFLSISAPPPFPTNPCLPSLSFTSFLNHFVSPSLPFPSPIPNHFHPPSPALSLPFHAHPYPSPPKLCVILQTHTHRRTHTFAPTAGSKPETIN